MNPVHIHLLLNHVPVIGTLVAIALLAWALLRRKPELTRASLAMFVVFALAGIVVYFTGEPAEHLVEDLPGVSHDAIEAHEEAALLATALLGGLGALALGGLVAFRRALSVPRGFAVLALGLSLLSATAMGWTANLGGKIRHTEIAAPAAGTDLTGVLAAHPETEEHGTDSLVSQALPAVPAQGGHEIPGAMRIEHAEIHEALVGATRTPGRVGAAAREVARVLDPHFVREEQIALPPLGLLQGLARGGAVTEEMMDVLPITDALAAELPGMLREHERIRAALEDLARVAREEGHPEYAALAEKIMVHAQMEEQVTSPAAVLVGEVVRMRLEE